ncbi:probable WRKY transcription factor 75 [Punica granatum]|uniref:WRKY domain-containing protein n=2 Tax=Punica granatum TaxID=22663 RepID=A0A218Y3H3_PUNGR|nr:probable WRKY transcription factor 75 [Punica granatum]OWM91371.1 hypothetical protein CDL15_Pgr017289 [Punica granatum]PKI33443.1 hypothetical protein CRG98_046174 [Punica granatum]
MNFVPAENPNPNYSLFPGNHSDPYPDELGLSDYLILGGGSLLEPSPLLEVKSAPEQVIPMTTLGGSTHTRAADAGIENENEIEGKRKVGKGCRIAFRTKSEQEILDDGFRWRKYGKKSVKNSPNPRNYYKCTNGGCNVKKRVERDRDDSSYVITTYEGVHTHPSPAPFLMHNYNNYAHT